MQPWEILLLSDSMVKSCVDTKESIDLCRKAIEALAKKEVIEDKFYLSIEKRHGFLKPMGAYISYPSEVLLLKTFSLFKDNPQKYKLPSITTLIVLYSPETGLPVAVMDGDHITGLKTSGTTAVAAELLARKDSRVLGIIGAGFQGRYHLKALNSIFKFDEVRVFDISKEAMKKFAEEMGKLEGLTIKTTNSYEEVCKGADIIVTVTVGDEPMVDAKWLSDGVFVAKVGSYQELNPNVITSADKVVVDSWKYTVEYGRVKELVGLVKSGKFSKKDLYAELPDLVAGKKKGRSNEKEKTLYISIGYGADNAAIAGYVYQKAIERGIGQKFKLK